MLSIPLVTSWISDDLGEHFWSLLALSLLSIPLVTSWISVDLGEHFWSLLGPSVLSIPLMTSWISDDLGEHFLGGHPRRTPLPRHTAPHKARGT